MLDKKNGFYIIRITKFCIMRLTTLNYKANNIHKHMGNQDTRKRIINSALKIFSTNDFAHAKISDIAKLAKVSDAAVYKFFKSKGDLLFVIPNLNCPGIPNQKCLEKVRCW